MIGKTISHYRILSQLGGGGVGVVYEAEGLRVYRHVENFPRGVSSRAFSGTQTPSQWAYHRWFLSATL
jgi:hypothetical protein